MSRLTITAKRIGKNITLPRVGEQIRLPESDDMGTEFCKLSRNVPED